MGLVIMSGQVEEVPKRIVVRMPNWLGDCVMATPILRDLRQKFPDAEITAMAQSNTAPLLREDPHIDQLYSFTRPSGWLHRQENRDAIRTLRSGDYDLGILLTNSLSSAWWFWRAGIRQRLGFATHWRTWLLTQAVRLPASIETQHLVRTYKEILRPLGIAPSKSKPRLYLNEEEKDAASELFARYGVRPGHILLGINPGAAYGSAKCWLPSRFRHVTQRLLENPAVRVAFFGDSQGRQLVRDICVGMSDRVINLAGETSLRELMALIERCDVFLTNDSGPMHIAAALGTPLLALFGSTNETKTGPYEFGKVIHKHVDCSPCYLRKCPIDFRCMKGIEVEEVYQNLKEMINEHVSPEVGGALSR